MTIGDLLDHLKLGEWFQRYYLLPLSGAIWSTPPEEIRAFPARALVQFFRNHALMSVKGQHQWWTVDGGSIEYVRRLEPYLRAKGVSLRTGQPVKSVTRTGSEATLSFDGQPSETFDHVIFACHSDQALRLLERPTKDEQATLGVMRFQDNHVVLHRDEGQMPKRRPVWSSWVYRADTTRPEPKIGVTYWMNRLQNIPENDPLFVTLNPSDDIRDELIYDAETFRHPVFDRAALAAQDRLRTMQGDNNTWFAGAYTRHGFHEDGFASALRVTRALEKRAAEACFTPVSVLDTQPA